MKILTITILKTKNRETEKNEGKYPKTESLRIINLNVRETKENLIELEEQHKINNVSSMQKW